MLLKDGVRAHPKVLRAGAEAAWLWACCIDYSRAQLTDGFVPSEALPTLASTHLRLSTLVDRLCEVGLLHREDGGVRVHDYLEHNDSAERVRSERSAATARQQAHRAKAASRRDDSVTVASQRDSDVTDASPRARVGVGVGVGSTSERNGRHVGLVSRRDMSSPFDWLLPVPAKLHRQWVPREATRTAGDMEAAERVLLAWYAETAEAWNDRPLPGDDEFDFWRKRYAEWRGSSDAKPADRPRPQPPRAAQLLAEERL